MPRELRTSLVFTSDDTLLASLHDCLLHFSLGSFVQETSVSLYARAIILPPPLFDDSLCSIGISRSIQSPMSAQKSSKSTQQIPISALKSPITAQKGFVTVQKNHLYTRPEPTREMRSARCFRTCVRRSEIPHNLSSTGARRSTSVVCAVSCVCCAAAYLEEGGVVWPLQGPAIFVTPVLRPNVS